MQFGNNNDQYPMLNIVEYYDLYFLIRDFNEFYFIYLHFMYFASTKLITIIL